MNSLMEYELYVPLVSSSKTRHPARRLTGLKGELTKRFGGLTHFPQKIKGLWKIGPVTFYDEIVILRVLVVETPGSRRFWKQLKIRLEKEWKQKQVLVIARKVKLI